MKIKSQRDFWSGLMFVAVGIGFAWGATNYSFGAAARPGPGYFPFGLGILLAILGAFILFESLVVETEDGESAHRPVILEALEEDTAKSVPNCEEDEDDCGDAEGHCGNHCAYFRAVVFFVHRMLLAALLGASRSATR